MSESDHLAYYIFDCNYFKELMGHDLRAGGVPGCALKKSTSNCIALQYSDFRRSAQQYTGAASSSIQQCGAFAQDFIADCCQAKLVPAMPGMHRSCQ